MIATGIDIHGEVHKFICSNGVLWCDDLQLISLTIPEGFREIWCHNNQLTELILPEGVVYVNCWNNQLTNLDLPNSIKSLSADKEVIGLEKYIGKMEIKLW